MHTIAIAVSASAAGLVGWYSRASSKMAALIGAAGGRGPQPRTGQSRTGQSRGWYSSARWAAAAALSAGIVAAVLPVRGQTALPFLGRLALAVWAGALAILALIDHESLVIPTKVVRSAVLATIALLFSGSVATGDWNYFWQSAFCAGTAAGLFAAWAAISPRGLGFGDVRMAALVALGTGALSVPGSVTALACSPLVAGLVSRLQPGSRPGGKGAAVALGPYLAAGGLTMVMAHAAY
jgi:leader peptidase (prepilin peptidase)/N-methyltransferase